MPSATNTSREHRMLWERCSFASGIVYAVGQVGALAYFAVRVFPQMGPVGCEKAIRGRRAAISEL